MLHEDAIAQKSPAMTTVMDLPLVFYVAELILLGFLDLSAIKMVVYLLILMITTMTYQTWRSRVNADEQKHHKGVETASPQTGAFARAAIVLSFALLVWPLVEAAADSHSANW